MSDIALQAAILDGFTNFHALLSLAPKDVAARVPQYVRKQIEPNLNQTAQWISEFVLAMGGTDVAN